MAWGMGVVDGGGRWTVDVEVEVEVEQTAARPSPWAVGCLPYLTCPALTSSRGPTALGVRLAMGHGQSPKAQEDQEGFHSVSPVARRREEHAETNAKP